MVIFFLDFHAREDGQVYEDVQYVSVAFLSTFVMLFLCMGFFFVLLLQTGDPTSDSSFRFAFYYRQK